MKPVKMKEIVCSPETRCYALQHAIDNEGIVVAELFNIHTGKSRTGIGVRVNGMHTDSKGRKKPARKKVMFFFNHCPWCGNKLDIK